MEVIYNWLLHNTGNEGNYLTILNVQPRREDGEINDLDVMARTKNFETINLLIKSGPLSDETESLEGRSIEKEYCFVNVDQVIDYLSAGQEPNSLIRIDGTMLYVNVLKPADDSGDVSFPPQQ